MQFDAANIPQNADDHRIWGGMLPGSLPFALGSIAAQFNGLVLVITKDTQQAISLENGLRFYYGSEASEGMVLTFPDWETLPYDNFSPHEDIVSQRLKTLYTLPSQKNGIFIVPISTLLHRVAPKDFLVSRVLSLKIGQSVDIDEYRLVLNNAGYRMVETVYEHGEYALRGSIFDLFPMGSDAPIRVELFDEEIESLRHFDPDTQRTKTKLSEFEFLPANEFPWDKQARTNFRNNWLEKFPSSPSDIPFIKDIREGIQPPGIEYYSPLFFYHMGSLFDYLPDKTLVVCPQNLQEPIDHFWQEVNNRYEDRRHDIQRPILEPSELFMASDQLFARLKDSPNIRFHDQTEENKLGRYQLPCKSLPDLSVDERAESPLHSLKQQIENFSGRSLLVAESAGRKEVLSELLSNAKVDFQSITDWSEFLSYSAPVCLTVGTAQAGFVSDALGFQVVTETELFGARVIQSRRRAKATDSGEIAVKNLTELRVGAPVVHIDHGVGRYRGLETIEVDGQADEFLTLEYSGGSKLYVPVLNLHLISRYSGTDESLAPWHKLGSEKWSAAKQKAMEKIRDTAAELLEVYAKREAKKGFANQRPDQSYRAFCASFPFEETPDQINAINAVIKDMVSPKPMDRLVCGDVGFGKTEVAMRAAFVSTFSGKQVGVLVPTTLLAQQHYESFRDRFAETPVKVELLSRFKSTKEQSEAIKRIETGQADIVIGTHKLIQPDIKFKDLGLLIIDEEHRFGVQQKEKLKAFRSEVDILTLTATPIPRTLNMAMGGIRDLSIIATPPAKRLSVKTFVRQRETALVKEAVLREILRGGQVYYLHNEVKTIEKVAEELREIVPEARVGIAHGQMRERELEQAMSDFYHIRFNVLVCTTIIETGIDVPNANTIIIDRADKFGLAQLHQLRGRVGRSHHQAYAYLLTPVDKKITSDAEKRLEAISAAQDLGAGFMLATHDLEIRGAGELLGEEQSGQIQSIGFTLYMELLEQAVESLKEGKELSLETANHGAEVNLRISAIIPEDYLPDVHSRLILYKRIANCVTNDELKEIQVEMIDRFGMLPEQVKNLIRQSEVKLRAESLGIEKIDAGASGGKLEFSTNTQVDPLSIVKLVQTRPDLYRLDGATKLKFSWQAEQADKKLDDINLLLDRLSQPGS